MSSYISPKYLTQCAAALNEKSPSIAIILSHAAETIAELERKKTLNELRDQIHIWANSKGWWSRPADTIPAKLLLVHSEISEAAEELRQARPCPNGGPDVNFDDLRPLLIDRDSGKPIGFASELIDTIIRILDLAGRIGIDVDDAMERKVRYNFTRPMRHGGKAI